MKKIVTILFAILMVVGGCAQTDSDEQFEVDAQKYTTGFNNGVVEGYALGQQETLIFCDERLNEMIELGQLLIPQNEEIN